MTGLPRCLVSTKATRKMNRPVRPLQGDVGDHQGRSAGLCVRVRTGDVDRTDDGSWVSDTRTGCCHAAQTMATGAIEARAVGAGYLYFLSNKGRSWLLRFG